MNKFNFKMLIDESENGNIAIICGKTKALAGYYYWELCKFLKCNPTYTTQVDGYSSKEYAIKIKNGGYIFFCVETSEKLKGIYRQFEIYEVLEDE